jgi:hypothetical protein
MMIPIEFRILLEGEEPLATYFIRRFSRGQFERLDLNPGIHPFCQFG